MAIDTTRYLNDRDAIDRALASVADKVYTGDSCCPGCGSYTDSEVTYALYTTQRVGRAFSEDGSKPVGEEWSSRLRESSWDDDPEIDETDETDDAQAGYPAARTLVAPLYIDYGLRDASVYTDEACMALAERLVAALQAEGLNVVAPKSTDDHIVVLP